MNKVLELNSADYKFIDWLNTYQSKIPIEFFGEEWYIKSKKLKSFIQENSLQESVTFSDPRLIAIAFEMMMRMKKSIQSRLVNWFIVKEYLSIYELQDSEAINTYKEWVNSYMGYNFTDAQPDEETLADYNAKAEYILQADIDNIIPEFVKDELSANVYVEEFEEEDNTLLIEVANIMLKYAKGSVKKEWQSFLGSLSTKFAGGGGVGSTNITKEKCYNYWDNEIYYGGTSDYRDDDESNEIHSYLLAEYAMNHFDIEFDDDNEDIISNIEDWADDYAYEYNKKNKYAGGGGVEDENREMVLNQNKQIKHHTEELPSAVKKAHHVPAWVVAKVNRSANDLSDATHYLDGENEEYGKGANIKVSTGVFGEDEYWRVTESSVDYIGTYPKKIYSKEQAEKEFKKHLSKNKLATGGNMISKWFKN